MTKGTVWLEQIEHSQVYICMHVNKINSVFPVFLFAKWLKKPLYKVTFAFLHTKSYRKFLLTRVSLVCRSDKDKDKAKDWVVYINNSEQREQNPNNLDTNLSHHLNMQMFLLSLYSSETRLLWWVCTISFYLHLNTLLTWWFIQQNIRVGS